MHVVAISAATFHLIIDWHIGLFGPTSAVMTPAQAGITFGMSLLTAFWAVGIGWAACGEARGHATAFAVSLLWGFAGNGIPVVACPPPCSGAFPYADFSPVGSLVFGGAAAWASWRQLKTADEQARWLVPAIVVGITVVVFVLEASLSQ